MSISYVMLLVDGATTPMCYVILLVKDVMSVCYVALLIERAMSMSHAVLQVEGVMSMCYAVLQVEGGSRIPDRKTCQGADHQIIGRPFK